MLKSLPADRYFHCLALDHRWFSTVGTFVSLTVSLLEFLAVKLANAVGLDHWFQFHCIYFRRSAREANRSHAIEMCVLWSLVYQTLDNVTLLTMSDLNYQSHCSSHSHSTHVRNIANYFFSVAIETSNLL